MMDLPGYVANKVGVPVEAFRLLLTLMAGKIIGSKIIDYLTITCFFS